VNTKQGTSLRKLGQTEIEVMPIGLGVMQFAGGGSGFMGRMFRNLTTQEKNAIIGAALDGGINWFDTAEVYGAGHSEKGLSTALKAADAKDNEVVVATKWFPFFKTAGNIAKTIDDRVRCLDGYTIDLYMVHQPFGFSSPEAEMAAMADLVEAGKIRSVGVSNFSADNMRRAHKALQARGLPLAVNQVHYNLIHRDIETNGILETAQELGITIIAYTPLGYGLLTGKYHKDPELLRQSMLYRRLMIRRNLERSRPVVTALEEIASRYEVKPGQVALNWLVNFHGTSVVAIPGATRVEHARQSSGAMRFTLTADELSRLDEVSRGFL
jgi:aryl-alcohol dehydrogenase-like predicted oxidoreductase